ncbi:MAG: 1,4-alpha-glucan branching protein GlgB [Corynebacterium sp.]|nr:1,4-alpha-glucan branching protein GlgB [Corynebacterium sp.]
MSNEFDAARITPEDRELLQYCRHYNPHGIYGRHMLDNHNAVIRTRKLGADAVYVVAGENRIAMQPAGDDFFIAVVKAKDFEDYRLETHWGEFSEVQADAYHFLPTLGELDLHLIREGRHERLWTVLGANVRTYETSLGEVRGTAFAVWAPNAAGVAVIGEFCGWNPNQYPMRSLGATGVWEVFIPGIEAGTVYKFAVQTKEGTRIDKADPMARATEAPPATASIVAENDYKWNDAAWVVHRDETNYVESPVSIYEVHLGSWIQDLGYSGLEEKLVDYVADLGYTHVEFLPVAEHPFGGSWGYQVTGYYAPSARWGSPNALRRLIDAFHQRGIGVIVDWVPAHFPKDEFALARFDGTALYEHPDWRRGEQKDWGTYVFNFGRNEVRNFLVANALYWLEEFHVDGLRVDAVASMLYLDYSRNEGEWLPNEFGGREHLEAVQFLQEMNSTVHKTHPGVLTIAEESTSWPGVTAPTEHNGLGFDFKWNMGWMNDGLEYFSEDPINRNYHHDKITFSMVYAYSERYILPYSHDEVVHGKGSLWQRMPGDAWNKAAGLRTVLSYMYAHPGKKLLFQGQEFGQVSEWNEASSLEWDSLEGWEGEFHRGLQAEVRKLNGLYKEHAAFYDLDSDPAGFQWIIGDDRENNILAFLRKSSKGELVLCIFNFGGSSQLDYRIGVPQGEWNLVFNSDVADFAGAGNALATSIVTSDNAASHGFDSSLALHVPAMSAQFYTLRA